MADPALPMAELPPPDVKRWTIRRKAAVVTAVAVGVLTREEACRRYQLSEEEFLSWRQALRRTVSEVQARCNFSNIGAPVLVVATGHTVDSSRHCERGIAATLSGVDCSFDDASHSLHGAKRSD